MKIGVCKKCISTALPIHLTGFGNPARKFTGVHDDIFVSALVVENERQKAAIVTADVLGFDHNRVVELRREITARTGIPGAAVLFNASHTHSAPQVLKECSPGIGAYDAEYGEFFYRTVLDAVCSADADAEEGDLLYGTAECYGIGVNRRRISSGSYEFAPYEDGVRNDEVTVLEAVCGGRTKAILFQYTCHPSTTGFDEISADYPGVARRLVEAEFPGAAAIFLQGCCGNIRVRTVDETGLEFRGGKTEDVEHFGTLLAAAVKKALTSTQKLQGAVGGRTINFSVPMQQKRPFGEYQALLADPKTPYHTRFAYAKYITDYDHLPTERVYSVQRVDFGDLLTFMALEGEVCVEYDYHMKKLLPERHVVTAGYSNGMPGYICTADMYPYGGYEPVDSCSCYFVHEGFDPRIESVILAHAEELC